MTASMRFGLRGFVAVSIGVLFSLGVRAQDAPIPALTARVTDTAGLLTADQRDALESVLKDYETGAGAQIAVLTVASTAPEAIEQYGIRVAEAWKIGRKGTADGVILIVAKNNPPDLRRLRIEVGRGLEGAIPDATAKRIIDENIAPHFRQNDFYGGLVAGVARIESLIEADALPPPTSILAGGSQGPGLGIGVILFFFLVSMVFSVIRARKTGYVAGNRASNGGGSFGSSLGSMVAGAVIGAIANRGGGGGGGFGGGGGGGGGFSGGGGDFGGGGASGDW